MQRFLREFLHEEKGATSIEYGLIVALISLALINGVNHFTNAVVFLWSSNNSRLVQALTDR